MNIKKRLLWASLLVGVFLLGLNVRDIQNYSQSVITGFSNTKVNYPSSLADRKADSVIGVETEKSLLPAKEMLKKAFGSDKPFMGLSPSDTAKYLNYVVFNHCASTLPQTGQKDINELFEVCRTSCGGYAYVLRGLLAAHSIKTRYSNLYNLPQQGNHTMVEAEIEPGMWALFDPTFGVFFGLTGSVSDKPLSSEEVRYLLTPESIGKSVLMARKKPMKIGASFDGLYSQNFSAKNMELENYLKAEQAASVGTHSIVPLVLPIKISNSEATAGVFSFKAQKDGQSEFLRWSNETLNNSDPNDDVSYLFHVVGRYSPYYDSLNVIKIRGLIPGEVYEIEFHGHSDLEQTIQIATIGNAIRLNKTEPENVGANKFIIHRKFRSLSDKAELIFYKNDKETGLVNLFGVRAKLLSAGKR